MLAGVGLAVLAGRRVGPGETAAPPAAPEPEDPPPRGLRPLAAPPVLAVAPAAVTGRVLEDADRPVVGATVRALAPGSLEEHGVATTDAGGRFALGALPTGAVRLYVHSGRHRPAWIGPIVLPRPGEAEEVLVRLRAGRTLAGRVLDGEGRPVAGAHVGVNDEGARLVSTDASGRFELAGLGDRPVNLFATATGFAPRHLQAVKPGGRAVELRLERPGELQGRLSAPPGGTLRVHLCRHDAHFDREICLASRLYDPAERRFALTDLPSGHFDLVLEADGLGARLPVTIAAGRATDVGEVALRRAP